MKLQLSNRFENALHIGKRNKILRNVAKSKDLNTYYFDMDVNTYT